MKENEFYHGPIFPEMMGSIKNQFQIGDIVEISDLSSDGHTLKGFRKLKILEKYRHFLIAVATDPTCRESAYASATPIPILQLSCMCVHAYSFEIIYIHNLSSKFLYSPQLLRRSDVVEVLAGVVTSMFDFFHIIKPPFFYFFLNVCRLE